MAQGAANLLESQKKRAFAPLPVPPRGSRRSRRLRRLARGEARRPIRDAAEDFLVEVGDLGGPDAGPSAKPFAGSRGSPTWRFTSPGRTSPTSGRRGRDLIAFGRAFGLAAIEDHRSAEADGIVRIEIVDQGGRPRLHPLHRPADQLAHRRLLQLSRAGNAASARCCSTACARQARAASTGCSIPRSPISACATRDPAPRRGADRIRKRWRFRKASRRTGGCVRRTSARCSSSIARRRARHAIHRAQAQRRVARTIPRPGRPSRSSSPFSRPIRSSSRCGWSRARA